MIKNLFPREELKGFARRQARGKIAKTVRHEDAAKALGEGWTVVRKKKRTVALAREKSKPSLLESRVWTMLYRMGFPYLSGEGGSHLIWASGDPDSPTSQIDVVAVDDEVALYIECKSCEAPRKDGDFAEKLAKHSSIRKRFAEAVGKVLPTGKRRHVASIIFTWDVVLRDGDIRRAQQENVVVLDERALRYYEALAAHIGMGARYQLLAEVFEGKKIEGLQIRVPALRTRMGRYSCYTFSVKPEWLLKVAYVSHRAKGKATDSDCYQRMISKSRLKKIGEYITKEGIFPTNIVVNIERAKYLQFDRGKQEGDESGATFGWITLSPCYGSAWVIDGQHRLFAYAGHPKAARSHLNVLAFEELPGERQARFFVDINSEQKRVKKSLLVELAADLLWDAPQEEDWLMALVSKIALALSEDPDSPLRDRVLHADEIGSVTRCVSLTSIQAALSKPGFFIVRKVKGATEYGPLWREDRNYTLERSILAVKSWMGIIAAAAREWWDRGRDEGGGLAMNNGVTVCINVLRSILEVVGKRTNLRMLSDKDIVEFLGPYGKALGDFLAGMTEKERQVFRSLQGADGQMTGTRMCQEALHRKFEGFAPEGLLEWMKRREAHTNEEAQKIIDRIETTLKRVVLGKLKEHFTGYPNEWWVAGVPLQVKNKIDVRINEAGASGGTREQNFDLIHYREVILHSWPLFENIFSYGSGNKETKTSWIVEVNFVRNTVMHPSRQEYISLEKLQQIQEYERWLMERVSGLTVDKVM